MTETGRVIAVEVEVQGSQLSQQELVGATVLHVDDVTDFDEDGGQATVGPSGIVYDAQGQTHVYAPEVVTYTGIDEDASTVILAAPLSATWAEETEVEVYPRAVTRYAHVESEDEPDEVLVVRIPHNSLLQIPDGLRDPDAREAVAIEDQDGDWVVTDVLGRDPAIQATGMHDQDGREFIASWGFLRYRRRREEASGNVTSGSWSVLGFPTLVEDAGGFTVEGSESQHHLPREGLYLVMVNVHWAAASAGRRGLQVQYSEDGGSTWQNHPTLFDNQDAPPNGRASNHINGGIHVEGAAFRIRIRGLQNTGSGLAVAAASLEVIYIGGPAAAEVEGEPDPDST